MRKRFFSAVMAAMMLSLASVGAVSAAETTDFAVESVEQATTAATMTVRRKALKLREQPQKQQRPQLRTAVQGLKQLLLFQRKNTAWRTL